MTKIIYMQKEIKGSISISDSITEIRIYDFKGCTNLESVVITDGVTEIGEDAFC